MRIVSGPEAALHWSAWAGAAATRSAASVAAVASGRIMRGPFRWAMRMGRGRQRFLTPQAGSWKPIRQCDPSQKGLFAEAPQRHSV